MARWTKLVNEDTKRIDKKLHSKTDSSKKAFTKDKASLRDNRQHRVRPNTLPSASSHHTSSNQTPIQPNVSGNYNQPNTAIANTNQALQPGSNTQSNNSTTTNTTLTTTVIPSTASHSSSNQAVSLLVPISTLTEIPTHIPSTTTNAGSILASNATATSPNEVNDIAMTSCVPLYDPETVDFEENGCCSKNLPSPDSQDDPPIPPTAPSSQTILEELHPRRKSPRSSTSQKQL